jgi:hypothetical protein
MNENIGVLTVRVVGEEHLFAQHCRHDSDMQSVRAYNFEMIDELHHPVCGMQRLGREHVVSRKGVR